MDLINNKYQIDGIDVLSIVEKYGSPLYVYNSSKMREKFEKFTNAFKGVDLKINFACKALTNINVLKFFKSLGTGVDAVSIQESPVSASQGA